MAYLCSDCRTRFKRFHLSCPECGAWNSLKFRDAEILEGDARPILLSMISADLSPRMTTGEVEFDELLGGGFVVGSSVLLIGQPGAGKSTLVMQLLRSMNIPSLYVSGEESLHQLKLRANRLNIHAQHLLLLFEVNVNTIAAHVIEGESQVVVIDSIQTMYTHLSGAIPGSPSQIRKCTYILRRLAQKESIVLIIVGQVTKNMKAAGPKLLEHAVDVVLYLEVDEGHSKEESAGDRLLFASKNRFGSTEPRCNLTMHNTGLLFKRSGTRP